MNLNYITVFHDVTVYGMRNGYQRFEGKYCFLLPERRCIFCPKDGSSLLFQNGGTHLPNSTT
jgi:hypothetical protein